MSPPIRMRDPCLIGTSEAELEGAAGRWASRLPPRCRALASALPVAHGPAPQIGR